MSTTIDFLGGVGHGKLGVRSGLGTLADVMSASSMETDLTVEFRPGTVVSGWSVDQGGAYVATWDLTIDGMPRDVVSVKTASEPSLARAETLALCRSTPGTYYFDPDSAFSLPGMVWDSSYWDIGVAGGGDATTHYWDQVPQLYAHLTGNADPNTTTVLASFALHYSTRAMAQPHLGENKVPNGDFSTWTGASDAANWTEPSGSYVAVSQVTGVRGLAARVSVTGAPKAETLELKPSADQALVPGARYRLSFAYRTSGAGISARAWYRNGAGSAYVAADGLYSSATKVYLLDASTAGEWRRFSFDFVCPSGTWGNVVLGMSVDGGATGTVDFDEVHVDRVWRMNFFEPRVASRDVPALETGSNDVFFGGKTIGVGSISIINADGLLEPHLGLNAYLWLNCECLVRVGGAWPADSDLPYEAWQNQFTGLTQRYSVTDAKVTFDLMDARTFFHARVPQELYSDTESDVETRVIGLPRPLFFGVKTNITPSRYTKDAATLYGTYELASVTDAPNGIYSVDAVYAYVDAGEADRKTPSRRITLRSDSSEVLPTALGAQLKGWWKADDIASPPSDGGDLTTWTDRSGNGFDLTQAVAADKPSYHTTGGPNGKPFVRFDKANSEFMDTAQTLSSFIANNAGTLVAVFKPRALGTNDATWTNNEPVLTDTNRYVGFYLKNTGDAACVNNDGSEDAAVKAGINTTAWHVMVWAHESGNVKAWLDDWPISNSRWAASGNTTALTGNLRVARASGVYADVDVAEMIAFSAALSDSNRAGITRYLERKYAGALALATVYQDYTASLSTARVLVKHDVGPHEVTPEEQKINFDLGGSELTAALAAGLYEAHALADEVTKQLRAAAGGNGSDLSCTYSDATHKFTIGVPSGTLNLRTQNGTNSDITAYSVLGFQRGSNRTGSTSYAGDDAVFSDPDAEHVLRVNAKGYKDDASGTYTGVANALIERGADICRYLLVRVLKKPASIVDSASFADARTKAPESLGVYLNAVTDTKQIFDRLEYGNVANIVVDGSGKVFYRIYTGAVAADSPTVKDHDLLAGTWVAERGVTDVYPAIQVRYDEDPTSTEFRARVASDPSVSVMHGRSEMRTFDTYLTNDSNAITLAGRLLSLSRRPPRRVRFSTKGQLATVEVGDKLILSRRRGLDPSGAIAGSIFRVLGLSKNAVERIVSVDAVDDVASVAGVQCITSCQEFCQLQTQSPCAAACQEACQTACQEGCEVSAQGCGTTVCMDACQINCQVCGQATGPCQTGCQTSCQTCSEVGGQSCTTGCQVTCQVCGQGGGPCQTACETSCQVCGQSGGPCQVGCETSCQDCGQAAGPCQTSCETSCQDCGQGANCQDACQLGACQDSCQLFCQSSCESECQTPSQFVI